MKVIPEHLLKLMSPEDRKPLGKLGFTAQEMNLLNCKKREKSMHDGFGQWLRLNGIPYIHSRMDKKTTTQKGVPDFIVIYNDKALCIEFKVEGNGLSDDQKEFHLQLIRTGSIPLTMYSELAAIAATRAFIKLNHRKT